MQSCEYRHFVLHLVSCPWKEIVWLYFTMIHSHSLTLNDGERYHSYEHFLLNCNIFRDKFNIMIHSKINQNICKFFFNVFKKSSIHKTENHKKGSSYLTDGIIWPPTWGKKTPYRENLSTDFCRICTTYLFLFLLFFLRVLLMKYFNITIHY